MFQVFTDCVPKYYHHCYPPYTNLTYNRLKIRVTEITHSKSQNSSAEPWNELIEDLWIHLPRFKDEEELPLYDENCLKLDCRTLRYVYREDSTSNHSITWLDQSTSDTEVEIDGTSNGGEIKTHKATTLYFAQA